MEKIGEENTQEQEQTHPDEVPDKEGVGKTGNQKKVSEGCTHGEDSHSGNHPHEVYSRKTAGIF
jgi:hypothetical protein